MQALFVVLTLACFTAVFVLMVLCKRRQQQPPPPPPVEKPRDKAALREQVAARPDSDVGSEEEAETALLLMQERRRYALKKHRERALEAARQGVWMKAGTLISAETWDAVPPVLPTLLVTSRADLMGVAGDGVDLSAEDVKAADIVVITRGKAFPLHPNDSKEDRPLGV